MTLSYRSRRFLRRLGVAAASLAVLAVAGLLCWMLWLNRYVVYTQDGVRLDFGLSPEFPDGQAAVAPPTQPSLPIIYDDEPVSTPNKDALTQLRGYYVDFDTLFADPDAVRAQLEKLPHGTDILLDVKSVRGVALYSSTVVEKLAEKNVDKVDELISWMKDRYYLIARIPAFQDYWYGLNHVDHGLPRVGGHGSLWLDTEHRCYWLNPGSEGAVTYLVRTALELRNLGVHEVVFADFRFPNTNEIIFEGDRLAALNQTAADLVSSCATESFTVSFQRSDTALTLPVGRTRLYLTGIAAADAAAAAAAVAAADPAAQVVFFTDSGDTRYDAYGVMRPLGSFVEE